MSYNNVTYNDVHDNTQDGIAFLASSDHNGVTENVVYNNGSIGIHFYVASFDVAGTHHDNTVTENNVTGNFNTGICLKNSKDSTVIDNTSSGSTNGEGITLDYSHEITVTGNTANNNHCSGINIGLMEHHSNSNLITDNICNNNGTDGIGLTDSDTNAVRDNTCDNNTLDGIRISLESDNNTVQGNILTNNGRNGIRVQKADNNTITSNTVNGNGGDAWLNGGITIMQTSTGNTVENNTVNNNTRDGIHIYDASDNNSVVGNTINSNARYGIRIDDGCNGNTAHFNNIEGNTDYGISNHSGASLLDAENNWWGDASGPSDQGPGTGDGVSTNVDYDPWLGAELTEVKSETVSGSGKVEDTPTGGNVDIINATGDHTITTAKYEDNPGGTPTFAATGDYYDVHLSDDTNVTRLTIEFCPADAGTVIYYWDGTSWRCASSQIHVGDCIVVYITDSTFPSLEDLTGRYFASGTPYPPPPVGGEAYPINKVAVLAPWLALFAAIIAGASIFVRRRRA